MRTGELIQRVLSAFSGVQSDDSRLRRRHVYNKLISARNMIIEERLKAGLGLSQEFYTVLDFQTIEDSNLSDNELYGLEDCGIKRTECQLPKPYFYRGEPLIKRVSSVDGKVIFDKSDMYTDKYAVFGKFSAKIPRFFYKDGFIYLINVFEQKWIRIVYLMADLQDYISNDCLHPGQCIDITNLDFPVPESDIDRLVGMAIQELQYVMRQTTEETVEAIELGAGTVKNK